MADKKRDHSKSFTRIDGFSKETAKLKYENLQNDETGPSDEAFEDPVKSR